MTARRWATAAALLLLLTACAGPALPLRPSRGPVRAGTALPPAPSDLDRIPDAVPRVEPRSALGNPPFYEVDGHRYVVLSSAAGYVERGVASWYGPGFHGLRTSTGEPYDMFAMTAAHKTLPLPCYARVTNLSNGRSVVVRINDRGPFVANRIIDLSYAAATRLGMIRNGTAFVQVETLTPPFNRAPEAVSVPMPVQVPAVSAASAGVSSVPPVAARSPGSPAAQVTRPSATSSVTSGRPPVQAPASSAGPGAAGSAAFYIQVGAFSRPGNALRAAQKLRAAGFTPIITASSGTGLSLQRVRVGPIDSVQQFDALIGRLDALGFSGARLAQD